MPLKIGYECLLYLVTTAKNIIIFLNYVALNKKSEQIDLFIYITFNYSRF